MTVVGVVQSPVLVGRDDQLARSAAWLDAAAAGTGQLLFVAGEAGIGKTRLLGVIAGAAGARGFAVVRGAAFPGDGQSLAGLLLDLSSGLAAAPPPALAELGRASPAGCGRPSPVLTAFASTVACWCRRWPTWCCPRTPGPHC